MEVDLLKYIHDHPFYSDAVFVPVLIPVKDGAVLCRTRSPSVIPLSH